MPSIRIHIGGKHVSWRSAISVLGLVAAAVLAWQTPAEQSLTAMIVRTSDREMPWKYIDQATAFSGTTIPADTNVVFHLPASFERLHREVLFGQRGRKVRYWGYCLPDNYDDDVLERRSGLPGQFFLSEKEQAARKELRRSPPPSFSAQRLPSRFEIEQKYPGKPAIRHELDIFTPEYLCYVQSEQPLPFGLDPDGDNINDKLEQDGGTNPLVADTDADGIWDGVEFFRGTDPTDRDTDLDGIIDGLEDKNWNGKIDKGETDPRNRDSDRDGLCDGLCWARIGKTKMHAGEDRNVDGVVDEDETNPLLFDTDGNGSSDETEFLRCIVDQGIDKC